MAEVLQEEKANPRAAVRRVESFRDQKQVVRKACEPLSEVRECWPVHPEAADSCIEQFMFFIGFPNSIRI